MRFLIIQHLDIEPPGLLADHLLKAGHQFTVVHLDQNDQLPTYDSFDAVIMMGGPQSANDQTDYIVQELVWLRELLASGKPCLGICLGAQLMAKACGAEIITSPVRELGWHPVYHTSPGSEDALFAAMSEGLAVFQWHGESFSLTESMTLLATHPDVPAQAFRIRPAQYGLQFHVEVDQEIIESWIAHGESERQHLGIEGIRLLHKDSAVYLTAMQQFCSQLMQSWLEEINRLQ